MFPIPFYAMHSPTLKAKSHEIEPTIEETEKGIRVSGFITLQPGETFRGVEFTVVDGELEWDWMTSVPDDVVPTDTKLSDSISTQSAGEWYRWCTGVTDVRDPVYISVNRVNNTIEALLEDGAFNAHHHNSVSSSYSYYSPSGWYPRYVRETDHQHWYYGGEMTSVNRRIEAEFENYQWGDPNEGTWTYHSNRIIMDGDGTCGLQWTAYPWGEDSALLTGSAWINSN